MCNNIIVVSHSKVLSAPTTETMTTSQISRLPKVTSTKENSKLIKGFVNNDIIVKLFCWSDEKTKCGEERDCREQTVQSLSGTPSTRSHRQSVKRGHKMFRFINQSINMLVLVKYVGTKSTKENINFIERIFCQHSPPIPQTHLPHTSTTVPISQFIYGSSYSSSYNIDTLQI